MAREDAPTCKARTRAGSPCRAIAAFGTGVCRHHGACGLRRIRDEGLNLTIGRFSKSFPRNLWREAILELWRRTPLPIMEYWLCVMGEVEHIIEEFVPAGPGREAALQALKDRWDAVEVDPSITAAHMREE